MLRYSAGGGQYALMTKQSATQPAVPATSTDAEIEPQPCERCHTLVAPLHAGAIVPYFVCPPSQAVECLDRAKNLAADAAGQSPERNST